VIEDTPTGVTAGVAAGATVWALCPCLRRRAPAGGRCHPAARPYGGAGRAAGHRLSLRRRPQDRTCLFGRHRVAGRAGWGFGGLSRGPAQTCPQKLGTSSERAVWARKFQVKTALSQRRMAMICYERRSVRKRFRCERPHVGRRRRRHALLQRGLVLGRQRALEGIPGLQALPVVSDRFGKLLCQAEVLGQQQGIAHGDIGRSEAAGAEEIVRLQGRIHRAQPREEPAGVVGGHLRRQAIRRLHVGVAQHQRLREGERGVAHVQPVQVRAISRVGHRNVEVAGAVARGQVLADGGRFGQTHRPVHEQRHRAQRVVGQEMAGVHPRRKRQHAQGVGQAQFFQQPKGAERAGADAVVQGDHGAECRRALRPGASPAGGTRPGSVRSSRERRG
jgi:hypothetical protein